MKIFKTLKEFAYFLEYSETSNPNFWFFTCIFGIILNFSPLNPRYSIQSPTTEPCIEKTVAEQTALRICGGDGFVPGGFPSYGHGSHEGAADRGTDRGQNLDPKPRFSAGTGPSGNSGSSSNLSANKVPDPSEWDLDPKAWVDDARDSYQDFEESELSDKLPVNFEYVKDSNGNPTLLVPNIGRARNKRDYTKIDFDQTASHIHHAPDFGIVFPQGFDMAKYQGLDRAGRIEYTKQKLPRETIINYQNEIGKSMSPIFGVNTKSVPGFAGVRRQDTELTIQSTKPNTNILSIIREDGMHISSFLITDDKLKTIANNDFWVLKERNL